MYLLWVINSSWETTWGLQYKVSAAKPAGFQLQMQLSAALLFMWNSDCTLRNKKQEVLH